MDNRKNEIRAFLLTLLVVLITVLLLLFTGMHYEYPPRDMDLVQLKQDSIMFGGEYVMLGNTPQPTESEEMDTENPETAEEVAEQPSVEGDDLEDAGEPAKQAKPLVTAKEPSPMKVKEKPKEEKPQKTGPATNQKTESKQEQVKRGKETVAPKNDRVADAFGQSKNKGGGKQGVPDGSTEQGKSAGKPGIQGLDGYTLENWKPYPRSRWAGTVTVRVTVNPRGKVVAARATNATGELASHPEVRRDCEQKAMNCQFSVPKTTTTEGIGYITYRFI